MLGSVLVYFVGVTNWAYNSVRDLTINIERTYTVPYHQFLLVSHDNKTKRGGSLIKKLSRVFSQLNVEANTSARWPRW